MNRIWVLLSQLLPFTLACCSHFTHLITTTAPASYGPSVENESLAGPLLWLFIPYAWNRLKTFKGIKPWNPFTFKSQGIMVKLLNGDTEL